MTFVMRYNPTPPVSYNFNCFLLSKLSKLLYLFSLVQSEVFDYVANMSRAVGSSLVRSAYSTLL